MSDIKVRDFNPADRPALLAIIDRPDVADTYHRPSTYGRIFAAWMGERLVGFTHVNLESDLHQAADAWTAFDMPVAPHAYLIRIHVDPNVRGQGIGTFLIAHLAGEAGAHGCTFIGALLDRSGDMPARRRFFTRSGFTVSDVDNAGATPDDVLAVIGSH